MSSEKSQTRVVERAGVEHDAYPYDAASDKKLMRKVDLQ